MRYGGPYRIHDCKRILKAAADAKGRILFLYENEKLHSGREPAMEQGQNARSHYMREKGKSQCRK